MKNLIRKLTDIGVDESTLPQDKVKNRVLNSFTLLSSLFSPFFAFAFFYYGHWQPTLVFIFIFIWLLASLIIHSKKNHALFKHSLFTCIGLAIPFISLSLGIESGFGIYYFIIPVIAFHIYDLKERLRLLMLFFFFFISFLSNQFLNYLPSYPWVLLSPNAVHSLFEINLFVCFIFITLLTYSIVKTDTAFYSELEKTIDEKNILLAEVHHRVKNNLAVISSMFRLQMKDSNSEKMNDLLLNNSNRIYSMSQSHNKLYVQNNISNIQFHSYIEDLAGHLCDSYLAIKKVKVEYDLMAMTIGLDEATTAGLIINEIITNSIKHAFEKEMDPIIKLKLAKDEDNYQLIISDNGKGFDFETHGNDESIGVILIDSLINQMDGNYHFINEQGSTYYITLPLMTSSKALSNY